MTGRRPVRAEIPAVGDFPGGVRMYSPVTGAGSPSPRPPHVTPDSGGIDGRRTLGIVHEGPPGYGHGGMSAMLLDELMGWRRGNQVVVVQGACFLGEARPPSPPHRGAAAP
ncbi:hypothetical protein AB0D71_10740 [Streptomyces avermitilis]|uniref:hypothetical protein n=1 Tax=Streptomyces avermitilis TaxID=33903 RepID=UPI0033DACAA7